MVHDTDVGVIIGSCKHPEPFRRESVGQEAATLAAGAYGKGTLR